MIELGLERIQKLLNSFSHPESHFPIVHVAGTNGKGSTCAYLSSVLTSSSYRTGRFTSPHFLELNDCITINEQPLRRSEFDAYRQQVIDTGLTATPFEILTATAFLVFKEKQVDIAVVEVGLGGRLDATNVIPPPLLSILTCIGYDHTEFLGNSIESIAHHKAGIIKESSLGVVLSEQRYKEVLPVVQQEASRHKVPLSLALKPTNTHTENEITMLEFEYQQERIKIPIVLKGDYQLQNACTALTALFKLKEQGFHLINVSSLFQGFEKVTWPGRLESKELFGKTCILDGAHNKEAAEQLSSFLQNNYTQPLTWIVGFSKSKKYTEMLQEWVKEGDTVYAVPFSIPEGMPWVSCVAPNDIVVAVEALQLYNVRAFSFDCLQKALDSVKEQKNVSVVVVTGSLYLIADFYRLAWW
jgi:folylpolyglutamate synthase/dihydrofolate synthase